MKKTPEIPVYGASGYSFVLLQVLSDSNNIKYVALPNGFKVGKVELWCDGELIEQGKITL